MSITIGDAILWIRGRSDKLKTDLQQSETEIKGWTGRVGQSLKDSMNFAVGQIMSQGLNDLARGIQDLSRDLINVGTEYAQQVENLGRLAGARPEDASRMIQVADDMRVSYEDLTTALRTYSQRQGEAGQAANMSVDQLAALSDQYLRLAPGVERAQFLLDNFGRSGLSMGKLMEQGGQSIREMAASVDDSLVMTQEGIDQAREYEKAMDDWNDAIMGVKLQLFQALSPILEDFSTWLTEKGIPALRAFVTWFTNLPGPVKYIIVAIAGLIVVLAQLGPAIMGIAGLASMLGGGGALAGVGTFITGTLIPGIVSVGGAIVTFLLSPVGLLIAAIGLLIFVIYEFWDEAMHSLSLIGQIFLLLQQRAQAGLIQAFKNAINALKEFGKGVWDTLSDAGEAIGQFIDDTLSRLGDVWNQVTRAITDAFKAAVDGVRQWLYNLWNMIMDTARRIGTSIKNAFSSVGKGIVDGIWAGIQGGWEWLKTQIENNMNSLLQWVKDILGIASPSKVFAMEIGRPSAEGIGAGFEASIAGVAQRMGVAAASLPVAMQQVMSSSKFVQVGHVEYHGAFSQSEMEYLDRRSSRRAEDLIEEALR